MSQAKPFRVTVVVPAYNCQAVLKRSLESIMAQTCPPDEILVIDDGSTDETARIVRPFGNRIRYVYQTNQGVSAAGNAGIRLATCEWVCFLDSDDQWLPEKLEKQINLLTRNPGLVWCACNYYNMISNGTKRVANREEKTVRRMLNMEQNQAIEYFSLLDKEISCFARSGLMIRRSVFKQSGLFRKQQSSAEDMDLCLRIARRWPQIGYVAEPLWNYYYALPGSLSGRTLLSRLRMQNRVFRGHWAQSWRQPGGGAIRKTLRQHVLSYLKTAWESGDLPSLRYLTARYSRQFTLMANVLNSLYIIVPWEQIDAAGILSRTLKRFYRSGFYAGTRFDQRLNKDHRGQAANE